MVKKCEQASEWLCMCVRVCVCGSDCIGMILCTVGEEKRKLATKSSPALTFQIVRMVLVSPEVSYSIFA